MTAYYNDNDRHAAAWLRELIAAGMIMEGDIDERSITDVKGTDLKGYDRVHFFAGIGGWEYALQLAGWPTDRHVWTGSCPCQPLSGAGKRKGEKDERHLWPEFHRLIAECWPPVVFGEQVASADGREWFAGVRADLEAMDYAVGGADLCAASVGAPHIRQRLYWVAVSANSRHRKIRDCTEGQRESVSNSRLGDTNRPGLGELRSSQSVQPEQRPVECASGKVYWSNAILIPCGDGKARRIEPGISPLVNGIPGRVGLLRGYGNAIVPQVAAWFVRAFMEVLTNG